MNTIILKTAQTQHNMRIAVTSKSENPSESICAIFNENETENFSKEFLEDYVNNLDDEIPSLPIREGQMVWFNLQGNIQFRKSRKR